MCINCESNISKLNANLPCGDRATLRMMSGYCTTHMPNMAGIGLRYGVFVMRALLLDAQSGLFSPGTIESRGRAEAGGRCGAFQFSISLTKIAAKRTGDQSTDTDGAGVPNFGITEGPTVMENAATGSTISTGRLAIDEQNRPPSTAVEGYGLGLDVSGQVGLGQRNGIGGDRLAASQAVTPKEERG